MNRMAIVLAVMLILLGFSDNTRAATTLHPRDATCKIFFDYGKLISIKSEVSSGNYNSYYGSGTRVNIYATYPDASLTFVIPASKDDVVLTVNYNVPRGKFNPSPVIEIVANPGDLIPEFVNIKGTGYANFAGGTAETDELFCKASNLLSQYYEDLKIADIFDSTIKKWNNKNNPARYIH